MPMDNTLNVSELLKRLGVVGDSRGSAALLDQMRMSINVADLSDLVPPLRGPSAGGSFDSIPGSSKHGNWTVQCRSPGGLQILTVSAEGTQSSSFEFQMFVTETNPWAAPVVIPVEQLSFGQVALSVMTHGTTVPTVAPASALRVVRNDLHTTSKNFWIGPGQFFNVEMFAVNAPENLSILWLEFPGALNP